MTWTSHGHHMPGTPLIPNDPERPDVVGCTGVAGCYFCIEEFTEYKNEQEEKTNDKSDWKVKLSGAGS